MPADVDACLSMASACARIDADRARRLVAQAIRATEDMEYETTMLLCLQRAAEILLKLGDACSAYAMCLKAQPMLERLDDRWGATHVLKLRGRCCMDVGEHDLAQALFGEAVDRFDRMGRVVESASCRSLLATSYQCEGNFLAAVHVAKRARAERRAAPAPLGQRLDAVEAAARLQLARRLSGDGATALSMAELDIASAILPSIEEVDSSEGPQAALVLDLKARIARERGNSAARRTALAHMLALARRLGDPGTTGLAWLRSAQLQFEQRRFGAALSAARRAVRWLSQSLRSPKLPQAQRLVARILERTADSRGAYEAFCAALRHEATRHSHRLSARLALLALHDKSEQQLRESEQTLAYAQRFSNVGYLVASVNHELNQPLASIRLLAETTMELATHGQVDEVQQNLRSMHQICGRLTDVTSKLAAFPVRENAPVRTLGLRAVIDEALELLQSRFAQTPCEVQGLREEVYAKAHEEQVLHVVVNLVNNAIDAMAAQDSRVIRFACVVGIGTLTLTISDNGPGIPADIHGRLFHPFFSTKPAGQGLGLGLALSRDALRAMGGDLKARNGYSSGAFFDITLPHVPCP